MDSTFTCISSEELLVVEGGKIKTEDVCYWVGCRLWLFLFKASVRVLIVYFQRRDDKMEKFTSLSNIELMYIDGGFNAKGVWHKFTKKIKSCWDSFYQGFSDYNFY